MTADRKIQKRKQMRGYLLKEMEVEEEGSRWRMVVEERKRGLERILKA